MRDQNPETATLDFLRLFGDDVFIYMAGKSRSQVEGLLATDAFGDWERNNLEFKDTHPDAWAWFAPDGSQFDYGVWRRQIETGEREQMSGKEKIELAQQILGAALTRDAKSKMPANPTDADEEWLNEKKRQIDELFPGYAQRKIDINRTYANIDALTDAANDPLVEGEPVAEALKTYFSARDQFIVEAIDMGLSGERSLRQAKALSYARAELRSLADRLINDYPTFARVYDSVLAYEIEEP
jgi:hypothetical protein